MDGVNGGELGLEDWNGSLLNCSTSDIFAHLHTNEILGVKMSSELNCKPFNGGCGPINQLEQNVKTGAFASKGERNQGIEHNMRDQLDYTLAEQMADQNPVFNSHHKFLGKNVKESPISRETPKEGHVHVKPKQDHSTNNHTRAERIRREKISERMKILQDLVPGCSKINGKAAMLDEIINYVLSLQQQIEFLSMRVATVYPETDVGIQQITSRDASNKMVLSQDGCDDPRISSFHTLQDEIPYPTSSTPYSSMLNLVVPQASMWNNEDSKYERVQQYM